MALGLSLPVDIPWKRIGVSEDMIDHTVGDRKFPLRWRSSIALFEYQPPDEEQVLEGQSVTYLKVTCSITGFQPDPDEVGLKDRRVDSYWNDPVLIEHFKDVVSRYYGCYGAVLEVSVAPKGTAEELAKIPLDMWPCITDFEPKKRELYELVSESGEVMSRSLESVNVRKGSTTSDSHEVVDIFGGFDVAVSPGEGKPSGSLGVQGQWGTRDVSGEQYENVRTTDAGREQRETISHTTQLTQMYHQLDSYHLGTNRAVFMVLPRPHIVQTTTGFVNGPRLLEGVQEFFLVVSRPREIGPLCVEAYLETAHVLSDPVHEYERSVASFTLQVSKKAEDADDSLFIEDVVTYAEDSETFTPPAGWEIDLERNGGAQITSIDGQNVVSATDTNGPRKGPPRITEIDRDHVTVFGQVYAEMIDRPWPARNVLTDGHLLATITVYLRKTEPSVKEYEQHLWLTGRGVCSCPYAPPKGPATTNPVLGESLVWERPVLDLTDKVLGVGQALTVAEANRINLEISRQLRTSLNAYDRYPAGSVHFAEADFLAKSMAKLLRSRGHPDNGVISEIKGLPAPLQTKVSKIAAQVSRRRLLDMSLQEQSDRFALSLQESLSLRRAALGLQAPPPPAPQRWDRPKRK